MQSEVCWWLVQGITSYGPVPDTVATCTRPAVRLKGIKSFKVSTFSTSITIHRGLEGQTKFGMFGWFRGLFHSIGTLFWTFLLAQSLQLLAQLSSCLWSLWTCEVVCRTVGRKQIEFETIRWTFLRVSKVESSRDRRLKVMLLMYIAAVTGMELIKVDPELPVDHPPRDCKWSKTDSQKRCFTMFHNVSHVGPVNVRYVPLEWESNLPMFIFNLGRHQKPKGISISLNFFPVHFWCLALPPI